MVPKVGASRPDPQAFRDGPAHVGARVAQPLVDDGKRRLVAPDSTEIIKGLREDLLYSPIGVRGYIFPKERENIRLLDRCPSRKTAYMRTW